jgi:hypothetical protein
MSLFDVIKYPLSDHPTAAELAALPVQLFEGWCANTNRVTVASSKYYYVACTYKCMLISNNTREVERARDELRILKKMIKEYDEPI